MKLTLVREEWLPRAIAHRVRVEGLSADVRTRKQHGISHPIDDFMWTYYSQRPTQFMRWHPGYVVRLDDAPEYARERGYHVVDGMAEVAPDFVAQRRAALKWILDLQLRIMDREPRFGCFGLHEWAMVYQLEQSDVRHETAPLRLSRAQIAEVVEAQELKCTHYDAFRFYVPSARSLNHMILERDQQPENEQSGCLHANMDLYKWCYKAAPIVDSDLMVRCFELARRIRTLDMQAAPYDLSAWGLAPVPIETTEGRADYVKKQREFHSEALHLRRELITQLDAALQEHNIPAV